MTKAMSEMMRANQAPRNGRTRVVVDPTLLPDGPEALAPRDVDEGDDTAFFPIEQFYEE